MGFATSPMWRCFRMDLRRQWNGRRWGVLFASLLGGLAVQAVISHLWFSHSATLAQMSGEGWQWGFSVASSFGLLTPIWGLPTAHQVIVPGLPDNSVWLMPWMVFSAIAFATLLFVMPGVLAASIASDREVGRLNPLILTGMKPVQILVAKGLAAAVPFLVVVAVVCAGELLRYCFLIAPLLHQSSQIPAPYYGTMLHTGSVGPWATVALLTQALAQPFLYLTQIGILVCLSALCRQTSVALVACYGETLLRGLTLNLLLPFLALWLIPGDRNLRTILSTLLLLALQIRVARLLFSRAVLSLTFPDEPAVELAQPTEFPGGADSILA